MQECTFAVTLMRTDGSGEVKALFADVHSDEFRHRISFREGLALGGAFAPAFESELREILLKVSGANTVFAAPDHVIELPGLVLARLRVLTYAAGEGMTKITVRFKYFIGALSAVFKRQRYLDAPTLTHREAVAVMALEDVCLPACDLAVLAHAPALSLSGRNRLEQRIEQMAAQRDELHFYVDLLKRFVCHGSRVPVRPELDHGDLRQSLPQL